MSARSRLMLGREAEEMTRADLDRLLVPDRTATWQPMAHGAFVDIVEREMSAAGLSVVDRALGVWKSGLRFFGILTLSSAGSGAGGGEGDYTAVVGLRNSNDREFRAGLALGSRVFVCDNLAFSNEVVITRAHTSGLFRDLPGLVSRGVAQLVVARQKMGERIGTYKLVSVDDARAHDFLVRAVDRQVMPVTALPAALAEWRTPRYPEFLPRTVWSLFNAVTEVIKGTSAPLLMKRTETLHGLADQYSGIAAGTARVLP